MKNTKSAIPHLTSAIIALFLIVWPLPAQKIELSPQVQVSGPNPFADCTADQAYPFYSKVETEPVVLVNPLNPRHIVTLWMQDQWVNIPPARGLVSAASFDGGIRWSTSALPGRSLCFGGQFHWGADPWLTFSPDGGLYAIGLAGDLSRSNRPHRNAVLVNKSVDGSYWSNAIKLIDENTDHFNDQPAVAADPQNSNLAYAVWVRTGFNFGVPTTVMFTRTTDAGQSWEGARPIFTALSSDGAAKPQLVVQPGGTLIVLFKEMQYSGNRLVHEFLTAVRSTDKGLTWSGPTRGPELQTQGVVDPKTGLPVSLSGFPLVAQASDGNLYAVWQDGRFGAVGIAFAMSSDGAYTWSTPIRVNQTPNTIDAFTPSVAVAPDGTVAVTYFDFRFHSPASPGVATDYWIVTASPASPGGLTNAANWIERRLTDTSFDMQKAPSRLYGASYSIGDYQTLATSGNDFVAVWSMPHNTDRASIFIRQIQRKIK